MVYFKSSNISGPLREGSYLKDNVSMKVTDEETQLYLEEPSF